MDALRFLFIIDALETGGAERLVLSLTEKLIELGHDVNLLVIKDAIALQVPTGVKLHILNYRKSTLFPYNLLFAIRLRRLVSRLVAEDGVFELITSNLNLSNRLTHIARISNVYYCVHEAVSISSLAKRKGLKRFFRRLRFKRILDGKDIITVSDGVKDDLLNIVKIEPRSIKAIYNGVNFGRIKSLAETGENTIAGEYVVHVGRLSKEKRHDILLAAFKKSGIDCKLVIVGDGPERSNIEHMVRQLALEDRVIMTGRLENPYPVMKGAMMTLLSSDYEGLPTVLVESIVLSTPVVSVDCRYGPGEILGEKYKKYLAQQGDVDDLAGKIRMAMDDIQHNQLVTSPAYIKQFDIDNVVKEYISLVVMLRL